jgi:hypothetical protein
MADSIERGSCRPVAGQGRRGAGGRTVRNRDWTAWLYVCFDRPVEAMDPGRCRRGAAADQHAVTGVAQEESRALIARAAGESGAVRWMT